ncbi:MAG: substrate-binding domain-containing protein [Lachnospiraceae bacterium]|nr:substrate-binding domain-containing protein [Lachnospiraceae bacterium]
MKRKLLATLLTAAMTASLLAGCAAPAAGTAAAAPEASSEATEEAAAPAEGEKIKIGCSIWSSTDALGSQCKQILDAAAEAVGAEVQYVDTGFVADQVTASVEQLAAAGCQGIIICNSADSEMALATQTCNDNKVYLAQFFRVVSEENSPEIYKMVKESPYFIGAVHEDEIENGKELIRILTEEQGRRNIGLIGWVQGDATWLGRWEGYKQGIEAWNEAHPDDPATLSEPQYAGTSSDGGRQAAEALMSADPDTDALIAAGGNGNPLQGTIAAVEGAGKVGEIAIVSTDFIPELGERLADGSMAAESGGHYCDPLFAFMMVYNAIKGNYTVSTDSFEEIIFPYIFVASKEDYDNYAQYFVDELPYTQEELKAMSELSIEDLAKEAAIHSLADVQKRHAK